MGTPYTFDLGMSCHSTRVELFYFDDNFRRIAQWVPPFSPRVTQTFLKLDVQHGALVKQQDQQNNTDMRHEHFLNLTGDMGIPKRQRYATLAFLKIDM